MEYIYTDREHISSAFQTELDKLKDAVPRYKVLCLADTNKIDTITEWNSGTLNNISTGTLGTFGTNGNIQLVGTTGTYFTWDTPTKLMLHCDGIDGTTIFTDEIGKTVTTVGNSQVDTAQKKFGSGAGLFDGSGDYLTLADSDDWNLGTFDFTIDFWVKFNSVTNALLLQQRYQPTDNQAFQFYYETNTIHFSFYTTSEIQLINDWTPGTNNWYHLAAVRNGTNLMIFIDGTKLGTSYNIANSSIRDSTSLLTIGGGYAGYELNGWMDEIRFSKGTARWTSNFTPPINAYAADQQQTGTTSYGLIGTYTSKIFDNKLFVNYKQENISQILNAGTVLTQMRTGSNIADCDAGTWVTITSGTRPKANDNRFNQYRIIMSGDGTTTPIVDSIFGSFYYNPSDDPSTHLNSVGNINRSLESMFQETEISSISPTFDNTNGWWNQLGKIDNKGTISNVISILKNGQIGTPHVYNLVFPSATTCMVDGTVYTGTLTNMGTYSDIITGIDITMGTILAGGTTEITTGLFWCGKGIYNDKFEVWKGFEYSGTTEFIPAFTGYVDNINVNNAGLAILSAREKGKLFKLNTSENCTQTGTAGGAYWEDLRVDQAVEKLITQSADYGTNYDLKRTFIIDRGGTKSFTKFNLLSPLQDSGMPAQKGMEFLNGTYYIGLNIGDSGIFSYMELGTTKKLPNNSNGANNIANDGTNLYYYAGGNELFKYHLLGGTNEQIGNLNSAYFLEYNNGFIWHIGTYQGTNSRLVGYDVDTGTTIMKNTPQLGGGAYRFVADKSTDNLYCLIYLSGTTYFYKYNISGDSSTAIGTYTLNLTNEFDKLAFNEKEKYVLGFQNSGTNMYKLYDNGDFVGTILSGTKYRWLTYAGTINNYFYCTNLGTLLKYDGTSISNIGNIDNGTFTACSLYWNPEYNYGLGTIQEKLITKYGTALYQYSIEKNLYLGTFDVGAGDYIADVLQELAEYSFYVQYIDESGIYNFRNRDIGIINNYNFSISEVWDVNYIEGDSVNLSPIYNKVMWGTNTGTVIYEDLPSQGTYGKQTYQLQNKWISLASVANDVCYNIAEQFKYPKKIASLKLRWYPVVKLFDIITVDHPKLGSDRNKKWQVYGISEGLDDQTNLTLKEI